MLQKKKKRQLVHGFEQLVCWKQQLVHAEGTGFSVEDKPERLTQTDWTMDENHGNRLFSKQFTEARSETQHLGKDSFVLISAYQHLRRPKFLSSRCVKRPAPDSARSQLHYGLFCWKHTPSREQHTPSLRVSVVGSAATLQKSPA